MIPCSSYKSPAAPGWLVLIWGTFVFAATAEEQVYAEVGGEVTLEPKEGSFTNDTRSITWKVGGDLAVELEETSLIYFRHFQDRGYLDTRTGELTIKSLEYNDTDVYTTEIDGKAIDTIQLHVLSPVPVPTIDSSCPQDASTCTLTCEGDTTRAEPLKYSWMSNDKEIPGSSDKTFTFRLEDSNATEFRCKMKNSVSEKISESFSKPVTTDSLIPVVGGPKISSGIIVFVVLVVIVLSVAIFHRVKTGEWFFSKSSMPWEADFWRNTKRQSQIAASESNGTTSPSLMEQLDVETSNLDGHSSTEA